MKNTQINEPILTDEEIEKILDRLYLELEKVMMGIENNSVEVEAATNVISICEQLDKSDQISCEDLALIRVVGLSCHKLVEEFGCTHGNK